MIWRVLSYNGFDLDSDDYFSFLRFGDNPNVLPTVTTGTIKNGRNPVELGDITRELDTIAIHVVLQGTGVRTTLASALIGAFDNQDKTPHALVVHETVSNTDWYILAKVQNVVRVKRGVYKVLFEVPDTIWHKSATATLWSLLSSPDTQTITCIGNKKTRPKFTFATTASKKNGFLYRYWLPIRNPSLVNAFQNWQLDLTDGGLDTRDWLKDTANYVQINNGAGITDSQTTIPYDTLTGTMPAYGMGYIDDGVNQEQITWTGRTGTTSGNLTGVTREIGGTTKHAFADNTKIYLSYMQANGDDLRLYVDGIDQNLWVRSPNTDHTSLWCIANYAPAIQLTLSVAVAGSGVVDYFEFQRSAVTDKMLKALPTSGVILLDDEAFAFRDKDMATRRVFVEERAINDTVAALHSIGAVAYFIEHDAWLYGGNPVMDARVNDDTKEPTLDMDNSDNDTRVYTQFWDKLRLRPGSWIPGVLSDTAPDTVNPGARYYSGNHTDETADPATDMGMRLLSTYKTGRWMFETGKVACTLFEPAGIAQVTSWTYDKYRLGTGWPGIAGLQKSADGFNFYAIVNIATPAASGAWSGATTVGPYAMGSVAMFYLRALFAGTIIGGQSGGVGYEADLETDSITYTTLAPLIPRIMARGENSYEQDGKLTNAATGQYFIIRLTRKLGDEIEIDCAKKTAKTLDDNQFRRSAIVVPESQVEWMEFLPGDNDLTYEEDGLAGMDITVAYDDMLAV